MESEQLEMFRLRLLQLQQQLFADAETGSEAAGIVELDQARVGRLSRMDALQGQAMSQAMKQRREIEIKKTDAALERIERGAYGCCVSCEEDIAIKRLEFDPTASQCIHCANKSET